MGRHKSDLSDPRWSVISISDNTLAARAELNYLRESILARRRPDGIVKRSAQGSGGVVSPICAAVDVAAGRVSKLSGGGVAVAAKNVFRCTLSILVSLPT